MRLFFAGDIPEEHRILIEKIQERLKSANSDIKWVESKNLHITLRFIGEIRNKQLPNLEKLGREVGKLYGSFDVSLKGLGTFPPKGPPRVLWVGIDEGKAQISMIAQAIDSRLTKLNVKMEDHEFKAHISLGRFKTPKMPDDFPTKLNEETVEFKQWHFNAFHLKESQLTPKGAIYKNVLTFDLAPKDRTIHEKNLRLD